VPDELFDIKGVKKNCAAYAQRLSTLWPISGHRSLYEEEVVHDVLALQKRWRKRLEGLKLKHWSDLEPKGVLQFARNCPLDCVKAFGRKALRPCKLRAICPFCRMRSAAKLFNIISTYLPARSQLRTRGLNLLEVSSMLVLPRSDVGKYLSGHLLEWSLVPKRLQRRLKPLGAFRTISIDPKAIHGQQSAYRLTYRILALMPEGWVIPEWLDNGRRKIRLTYVQSKRQLVNVVGRTCRYPLGLMNGDLQMAIVCLNARRGKRLNEYTGCFSPRRTINVDDNGNR
jgi:hypothetical protein